MNRTRMPALATAAVGLGAVLALAAPLAASAHVTVDPTTAEPGSYTVIQLKVPNESDSATTTSVAVDLPTDTPFTSVRYVPVAGWTTELVRTTLPTPVMVGETEITEAVTRVVWTADDGVGIGAGQLAVFPLSLGPVPDVGRVSFPADQTYSDGTVVSWNEDGDDAEHPAPVLFINDAPVADHHDDGDGDSSGGEDHADEGDHAAQPTSSEPDVLARALGIAGLIVGVVGLIVAIAAVTAARRKPSA